jgi:hypothetical protein
VSKRSSEEEGSDPEGYENSNRVKRFGGSPHIQLAEWIQWKDDLFAAPVRSFFDWKSIDKPEDYFNIEFGSVLNPKTNDYFRSARSQGLDNKDFIKIVLTVAHFVDRAADNYPSNARHRERAARRKADREHKTFRPVPFGEIFAVLGTNVKDPECQFLFQGTGSGPRGEPIRFDNSESLPTSDFQVHLKFLILALSLLIEVGVLTISIESYPINQANQREDDLIPYDRRVRWFQELTLRCYTELEDYTFCFAPQALYGNLAWRVLVSTLRSAAGWSDCGFASLDCSGLNCAHLVDYIEQHFDYEKQPYWCPLIHRDKPLL